MPIKHVCEYCEEEFYKSPSQTKGSELHFCSQDCWKSHRRKELKPLRKVHTIKMGPIQKLILRRLCAKSWFTTNEFTSKGMHRFVFYEWKTPGNYNTFCTALRGLVIRGILTRRKVDRRYKGKKHQYVYKLNKKLIRAYI